MSKQILFTPNAAKATGHFSQGTLFSNTIFVSGQLGRTADLKIGDGIEEQTRMAMKSIGEILKAGGAGFEHVLKVQVILSDINNFTLMNNVYKEFFPSNPPARICFQAGLPGGYLVEIDAIAIKN